MMSRNEFLCVSGDRYKKFFRPKRTILFSKPEEENNGINIIAKNNEEEEYPYISICGPHGYRRHKVRLLVILNQGSTYLQMVIHRMPLLRITFGESMG